MHRSADLAHPNACRTNSFPTGTPVLMANGTHKPINHIKPGDQVRAYNTDTGIWSNRVVLDQWSHLDTDQMATITLNDGSQVSATDHHQFWVDDQGTWTDAENLKPGDHLLTPEGITPVGEVDHWNTNGTLVWELTVDTDHTFTVTTGTTDVLVHNCPERIVTNQEQIEHILDDHTLDGINRGSKIYFLEEDEIWDLINDAHRATPVEQIDGTFEWVADAGKDIGRDRATDAPTSIYTVITASDGHLITAFPGLP